MGMVRTIPWDRPVKPSRSRCFVPVRLFCRVRAMVSRGTGRKERVFTEISHAPLSSCTSWGREGVSSRRTPTAARRLRARESRGRAMTHTRRNWARYPS